MLPIRGAMELHPTPESWRVALFTAFGALRHRGRRPVRSRSSSRGSGAPRDRWRSSIGPGRPRRPSRPRSATLSATVDADTAWRHDPALRPRVALRVGGHRRRQRGRPTGERARRHRVPLGRSEPAHAHRRGSVPRARRRPRPGAPRARRARNGPEAPRHGRCPVRRTAASGHRVGRTPQPRERSAGRKRRTPRSGRRRTRCRRPSSA